MIYLIGVFINIIIMWYTVYFLNKVRFYPCILAKLENKIHLWSWIIAICGAVSGFMPYYSLRAIFRNDVTTEIAFIFQILVIIYGILLFIFHIKTTRHGKQTF